MARWAISDIHGCSKTFKRLLKKIALSKDDQLFVLGDLINRGPDSKGVIDRIIKLRKKGYNVEVLQGNHEDLLLQSIHDPGCVRRFLAYGGDKTLLSFNVTQVQKIPNTYLDFMRTAKFYIELDDFLLVHAMINFRSSQPYADFYAMTWQRDQWVDKKKLKNRKIVHGHVATSKKEVKAQFATGNPPAVLNIDAGCVYKRRRSNRLCALNLDTLKPRFSKNVD